MSVSDHIRKLGSALGTKGSGSGKVPLAIFVAAVVLVVCLGVAAYPTVSNWQNDRVQAGVIADYTAAVEAADPQQLKDMREAATAYNKQLATDSHRFFVTDEQRAAYDELLDIMGTGVMGYVQIPKIGVTLPVYHGTDEVNLQGAVGHIVGTSLPVGGSGTHCAITAHRGLVTAKLFTDLDQVVEGDAFTVTVLDQTLAYEVDQIRIVEPTDLSDLDIVADQDLMTLVTCTPLGINTQRLLVRGHRVQNLSDVVTTTDGAVQMSGLIAVLAVVVPVVFVGLLVALVMRRRRQGGVDKGEAMDAVRSYAKDLKERNIDKDK